jgi:hypothetical protein
MRIPLGACVKRGGGDWRAERESGGGWRGFDGSIKKEKKKKGKEKRNPPFPSFLSSPSTLMWNGAIPTSAQVVDCRRRGSVASSWSSAFSTFAFHPDISTFYFFFQCFFFLHNNNDPSAYKAQEEEELPVENPKRRWFPGASPNKFRSSIFFFFSYI